MLKVEKHWYDSCVVVKAQFVEQREEKNTNEFVLFVGQSSEKFDS